MPTPDLNQGQIEVKNKISHAKTVRTLLKRHNKETIIVFAEQIIWL